MNSRGFQHCWRMLDDELQTPLSWQQIFFRRIICLFVKLGDSIVKWDMFQFRILTTVDKRDRKTKAKSHISRKRCRRNEMSSREVKAAQEPFPAHRKRACWYQIHNRCPLSSIYTIHSFRNEIKSFLCRLPIRFQWLVWHIVAKIHTHKPIYSWIRNTRVRGVEKPLNEFAKLKKKTEKRKKRR